MLEGVEELSRARNRARARKHAGFELDGLEYRHVRVDALFEELGILLARLHLERELGDLSRAAVNLHAEEVILQDKRWDVLREVALLLIDFEEQVECVHEDMP